MAGEGAVRVAAFHPERTDESTAHAYFTRMARVRLG